MIPVMQWLPVQPVVYTARSPSNLRKALTQFNVEEHSRYKPFLINKKLVTWCNIFRWDGTRALGVEVPHWYMPETGEVRGHHALGASEMTSNTVAAWLKEHGARRGWKQVSRKEGENDAMAGKVVVLNWKNESGAHGHEAFMLPDSKVIQAGAYCGVARLEAVFPQPLAVTFWSHE